jgi:glycosyltransferase involved in cell wall biosynthesis
MSNSREIKVAALASTLAVGGAERQLAALARGLRDRGYRLSFFFLRAAGAVGDELRGDGFDVEAHIAARPERWPAFLARLRDHDLLVALDHNNVLKLASTFAGALPPYVVLYHLQGEPPRGWRRALQRAAAVAAVAESQLAPLRRADITATRFIANGVATPPAVDAAGRRRARADLGLPVEAVVAAAVSRLSPEKGVDVLLEALASSDEGRRPFLALAGDGRERSRLEEFARAHLAGGFSFLGELADVTPLYRASDLFVLPSRRESTPLALLEAMSYGLAAVAAAVGDVPAILSGGAGVTCAPGSSEEFARAVTELAGDPARRVAMGAAARAAVAERYELSRMLDEYDALFEELSEEDRKDGTGDA